MLSRRQLLRRTAALAAASTLAPRSARAAVSAEDLKFVFVMAFRGWDVTRVYAPLFDNPVVSMEADAEQMEIGNLTLVDHASRPSVRAFFEAWRDRALVLNGITVPSLSHVECLRLMMTGSNSATDADWPARIAARAADRYALPHVIVEGPAFPGTNGAYVTRIGSTGYVEEVLEGTLLARADGAIRPFSTAGGAAMDAVVNQLSSARAGRAVAAREQALTAAHASSLTRLATLRERAADLSWPADNALESQNALAIDLLSQGLSRCVTLSHESLDRDSHNENDSRQAYTFEALFAGLSDLMDQLSTTPGTVGETLADETVVVVMSEMARTPQLNGGAGKDHWPHTSALLVGPNLTGDRMVGGFGELVTGLPLDLATGEVSESGTIVSHKVFGATLLALAGIDPGDELGSVSPVDGVLA